jgi:DNA-binding PadR family transcriptional regulator
MTGPRPDGRPKPTPTDLDENRRQTGVGVSGSGGGPGSWGAGGWGPGGFGGPGGHGGRGRGESVVPGDNPPTPGPETNLEPLRGATVGGHRDLLAAILLLLDEWAMRGSQIAREIAERSGSTWLVAASSVEEALDSLELAGMIARSDVAGHEVAHLTSRGKAYVDNNRDDLGSPCDDVENVADTSRARDRAERAPSSW